MAKIKGKDVLLEIYDGGFTPLICATSCSINLTPELINKTTLSSGRWNEYAVRRFDWSIDLAGVSQLTGTGYKFYQLFNTSNILAGFQIRMTFEDSDGNTVVFTGSVMLEDISAGGDASDFSLFEGTMKGTGAYNMTVTIDGVVSASNILAEDGDDILTEGGELILTE